MKAKLIMTIVAGAALCGFSACEEREGPMEEAGEAVDERTEEVTETVVVEED